VTYRVGDAKRLAALLNYTLAPNGQNYTSEDPEKLPERVIHVINVLARAELKNSRCAKPSALRTNWSRR
jgi:hypothetical protein